jgi:hypothetical protein
MERNEILQGPHHRGVSSGASKTISEPMVCSVQTVQCLASRLALSPNRLKMSFCLSLITLESHWVHLKWFLTLWYVRRKPITYLASRLALSPNGPKRAFPWASSSRNSIGCIENNFLACGTFAELDHLSSTYTNTFSKRTEMRFEYHPVRSKQFLSLWYVGRKQCTYLAWRLALSPNEPKWDSSWPTSPRSFIGCV